jgi:hypothetical protein
MRHPELVEGLSLPKDTQGPAMRALDDLCKRQTQRNCDALGYPSAKDFDVAPLLSTNDNFSLRAISKNED